MHFLSIALAAASLLSSILSQVTFGTSPKRGLVHVISKDHPGVDDLIWTKGDLTWYYNYQIYPTDAYANISQSQFEFVPQLWGVNNTFLSNVVAMIKGGRNITHILTYNEPDGTNTNGGSGISPTDAAANWISQVEPLRKMGIKVGAPTVTGSPGGFTWLASFFASCQSQGTNCTADFYPIHWYGDFQGLASHMGQMVGTFGNITMWVTEYALAHQSLSASQDFFNVSAQYFDRLGFVDRYSYFGAFRSDVSNVGPNASMLTEKGALTDIGSWYLGGAATNNIPQVSASSMKLRTSWLLVMIAAIAFSSFLVV